jgi:hypothetical protein
MPSIAAHALELSSAYAAGSSAFAALIWWVVPATGLLGGIAYVVWVSKFKRKFESETSRSVGAFQRFQKSFRDEPPAKPAVDEKPDFLG